MAARCPERTRDDTGLDVVTGAFSYSGRAIARHLQHAGRQVRTLTGHPERVPATRDDIEVRPLDFDDRRDWLRRCGAPRRCTTPIGSASPTAESTTPWRWRTPAPCSRRPDRPGCTRSSTSRSCIPRLDSPYPYFRGKALVERALAESRASLRRRCGRRFSSTNTACCSTTSPGCLRRLPVFAVGGGRRLPGSAHPRRRSGRAGGRGGVVAR